MLVAGRLAVVVSPGKPAEIAAIDVRDGHELWHRQLAVPVDRAEVIGRLIVALGPEHAVVLDVASGATVTTVDAAVTAVSRGGVLLTDDGASVSGIDATTGKLLWIRHDDVRLVDVCRGLVLLAGRTADSGIEGIDQRTGATRWRSTHRLEPGTGSITCGGPWMYVANGASVAELELGNGMRNWQTPIDGAHRFEFLGYETGIAFGSGGATGINLWDGVVLWSSPTDAVGEHVDIAAWLRSRDDRLFKLLPWSGTATMAVDPFAGLTASTTPDAPFEVIHASESRVTVRRGATIATLGLNDLGLSWSLELPAVPHWADAGAGTLVVVDDDSIDGYIPAPLVVGV